MTASPRLSVLMALIAPFFLVPCQAEEWTSQDGKTIVAGFVRLNPGQTAVILNVGGKTYEVGLVRLSDASRKQALRLHDEKRVWAQQEVNKPLLTEEILLELARFDRGLVAGRHYLVEGRVMKILPPASVASTQPMLLLDFGTESKTDFSAYGRPPEYKLGITPEKISLLRTAKSSGLRIYQHSADLVAVGQLVVINARVDDETIVGLGIADFDAVKAARVSASPQTFSAFQAKRSMGPLSLPVPKTPSPSTGNAFLEWLSSLLGQGR